MDLGLRGKTAVVSGSTAGIGLAIASLGASTGTAHAQAPAQQGWWTATNPGNVGGLSEAPAPKPWTKWSAPSAMSATVARPNAVVATVAANVSGSVLAET